MAVYTTLKRTISVFIYRHCFIVVIVVFFFKNVFFFGGGGGGGGEVGEFSKKNHNPLYQDFITTLAGLFFPAE